MRFGSTNAIARRKMLDHLEHDVVQFYGTLAEFTQHDDSDSLELPRDRPERIRQNMAFEGLPLHARVLDDFLSQKPKYSDDF